MTAAAICSIGIMAFVQTQLFKTEVNTWAEASTESTNALQNNTYTYKPKSIPYTSYVPTSPPKITIHSEEIIDPRRYVQERQEEKSSAPIEADPPATEQEKIVASEEHPVDEVLGAVRNEEAVETPAEPLEASIEEMVDMPTDPIDAPTHPVDTSTSPVEETVVHAPAELPPEQRFQVEIPQGNKLTKSKGVFEGPSGRESWYNLPMVKIVEIMRQAGYNEEEYPYWVREDGCKMLGPYILCAGNLEIRPRGTIVQTSLGAAIIADTGPFCKKNKTAIDLAVNWAN